MLLSNVGLKSQILPIFQFCSFLSCYWWFNPISLPQTYYIVNSFFPCPAFPEWQEAINSTEKDISSEYTMSCLASGKPKPHVRWLKNGHAVRELIMLQHTDKKGFFGLILEENCLSNQFWFHVGGVYMTPKRVLKKVLLHRDKNKSKVFVLFI